MLALQPRLEEDVGRLHVAVDEPGGVRGVETLGDLLDDGDRPRGIESPLRTDHLPQVTALDLLHGEIQNAVRLPRRDGPHDVRIVDGGRRPRLAQEPHPKSLVRLERGEEDLQGDAAPACHVLGEVDRAGRPLRQERPDPELVDGADEGRPACHDSVRVWHGAMARATSQSS